jgi:hypothetical protein
MMEMGRKSIHEIPGQLLMMVLTIMNLLLVSVAGGVRFCPCLCRPESAVLEVSLSTTVIFSYSSQKLIIFECAFIS